MLVRIKKLMYCYICIIAFMVVRCNSVNGYLFSHLITYPPGTSAHEGNWEYIGDVSFKKPGKSTGLTDVKIEVEDRAGKNLLYDEFKIEQPYTDVDPCEVWDVFDTLIIYLAIGSPGQCDDSGAVYIDERVYVYNSNKVKFVLSE